MPRYWLTPPEFEYLREGRFDPTPYPHAFGDRNALLTHWEKPWYLNPPFAQVTRFVRKAIEEGGPGKIIMPCPMAIHLLLESGAELEPAGRVQWIEVETGERMKNPGLCLIATIPARPTEGERK